MPLKVFLIRIWPGCRVGRGWVSVYWSLEESPVSGRRTARILEGREDIVVVVWWKGRAVGVSWCLREESLVAGEEGSVGRVRERSMGLDMKSIEDGRK